MRPQLRQTLATVGLVLVLVVAGGALLLLPRLTDTSSSQPTGTPSGTPSASPGPATGLPAPGTDAFDELLANAPTPAALKRTMGRRGMRQVSGPPPAHDLAVRVATFNLLGASHTIGPHRRKNYAVGIQRVPGQVAMLESKGVTVAGFQEFQRSQVQRFREVTRGQWALHPGMSQGPWLAENSVGWRKDTWQPVETHIIDIPYFAGHPRGMAYALLQHRQTGHRIWIANFHNPANIGGDFARFRAQAVQIEVALAKRLRATGIPVVFTGDMNDRSAFACPFTAGSGMHSADGTHTDAKGRCRTASRLEIDWILGSRQVTFSQFEVDNSSRGQRLTDHPLITATATLPAARNASKCTVRASTKGYLWFCPRKNAG
ncbi:endonuclease/exonuclease/phosphatase family protein [Nocardioides sp.]|uniref:endonuclease/exonuclease/phosphatase family protein n=1 Tax=Nocardioides sp. TaxID=35761 RepID=UPI002C81D9ED|nr:endonuclease/exonuclease/phosphatase family protein [Nocardioides sp.]HSX67657.1 endonuclease/exonuclease/phosphatase family protein [Nocardioides sp.]